MGLFKCASREKRWLVQSLVMGRRCEHRLTGRERECKIASWKERENWGRKKGIIEKYQKDRHWLMNFILLLKYADKYLDTGDGTWKIQRLRLAVWHSLSNQYPLHTHTRTHARAHTHTHLHCRNRVSHKLGINPQWPCVCTDTLRCLQQGASP